MSHLKNIAILGGSGRFGSGALNALIDAGFNITAITRTDSQSSFPSAVKVVRGSYDDRSFLVSALKGQDAFVIILGVGVPHDLQTRLIDAAAEAEVPWILPNEYGSDNSNHDIVKDIPFNAEKLQYPAHIEKLGKSSWIGIVNGCWYDYSLAGGYYFIDISKRTAKLLDGGNIKTSSSTLAQAGLAVARVLSLPLTSSNGPSLSDFKNKYVYVESFEVSQRDMLESVQRATSTSDADWEITHDTTEKVVEAGLARTKAGDFWGMVNVLYAHQFMDGGNYHAKIDNKVLGLEVGDLDKETARVVKIVQDGGKI